MVRRSLCVSGPWHPNREEVWVESVPCFLGSAIVMESAYDLAHRDLNAVSTCAIVTYNLLGVNGTRITGTYLRLWSEVTER